MKHYYELLGINEDANEQEIKTAYRKLSLKYHPDRNPDDKVAEEKFKEINEAYQTLGNAEKKHMYDLGMAPQDRFQSQNPINDILRSMGINIDFQQNPFNKTGNQKFVIKQQINISLHDAVFGCDIELDVPSYINCSDCNGIGGNKATCKQCSGSGQVITHLGTMQIPSGCITCNGAGYILTSTCHTCNREGFKKKTRHIKFKIPAGIQNQSSIRIGTDTNDRCEIIIAVNVFKHNRISRNGATLFSTETISCLDAMIGGTKKVETLDGYYDVIIPPGTQQGEQLVIAGKGGVLTNGRANYIVNVHIEIPKNLTPEQIKKIQEIKDNKIIKN